MNWFSRKKLGLTLLIVILVLAVFVGLLTSKRTGTTIIEGGMTTAASPIEKIFYTTSLNLNRFIDDILEFGTLRELKEENEKKIQSLEMQVAQYQLAANENESLRNELGFMNDNPQFNTLPGEVIGIDPNNGFSYLMINKGTQDGLGVDMPVTTGSGLIGKISEVSATTSKVRTIIDPLSTINGKSTRSGSFIRIEGALDQGLVGFIEPGMDVTAGDYVVTSGLYGNFPGNLFIGTVSRVEEQQGSLELKVFIDPTVNLKMVDVVGVLRQG